MKKLLSVFLAVLISTSTLFTGVVLVEGADAIDDTVVESGDIVDTENTGNIASGTCGDVLTWVIDNNGVLTVSGTGAIPDFTYNGTPWYDYRARVTSAVIESGITHIGSWAFGICQNMKEVSIGDSVKTIGEMAFYSCSSLKSITLPQSVETIGESAFESCSGLEVLDIPNGVLTIDAYAFRYCGTISSVSIPESVTSISHDAFENCEGLMTITVADGNSKYRSSGNCIIDTETKTLLLGCNGSIIPCDGSITSIGRYAFSGCKFESVLIPTGVTIIEDSAFYDNYELKSVIISDGVTTIESSAFSSCYQLSSILIPDSVTNMGYGLFDGVDSYMLTIYGQSGSEAEYYAIYNGYNFVSIQGGGIISSGSCGSNANWKLGIDGKLTISGSGEMYLEYSQWQELTDFIVSVEICDGITSVIDYAFSGCGLLKSVSIADSVISIGEYVFFDCVSLTDIMIPNRLAHLGSGAFYRCTSLKEVVIPESIGIICAETFTLCSSLEAITIPESVHTIGESAFWDCKTIKEINIPAGVNYIGTEAFVGCSGLQSITVALENSNYYSVDNCLIETASKVLIVGCNTSTIPTDEGIVAIGDRAFYDCIGLTAVSIPVGVETIGESAFNGCTGITSLSLPNGLVTIGSYAFNGCTSLNFLRIPSTVQSIGEYAFSACIRLTSANLPQKITVISNGMFYGCSNLRTIKIPETVTSIGSNAFYECSKIDYITIPYGVTSIGSRAFYNCTNAKSIDIPDTVETIGMEAFRYCNTVASIHIPMSVNSIGPAVLSNCAALTTITVDEANETYKAVNNCLIDTTTRVLINGCNGSILPNDGSFSEIGGEAFAGCDSFVSITIPASVEAIRYYAFYDCSSLETVIIPASVTEIEYGSFYGCNALTIKGVAGSYAETYANDNYIDFEAVTLEDLDVASGTCGENLTWVLDGNNTLKITGTGPIDDFISSGDHPWYQYKDLIHYVEISEGVTSIGYNAFGQHGNIVSVTLPNCLENIEDFAFFGCSSLTEITIPESVISIGVDAFSECVQLAKILGYSNSAAETYANYAGIYFESLTIGDLVIVSGSCGDNVIWSLREAGKLTICGKGDMYAYDFAYAPWYDYNGSIKHIEICNGVTSISSYAFIDCYFEEITMADSITVIGAHAFDSCCSANVGTITLPSGLVSIEYGAFAYSCLFENVIIQEGTEYIGNGAFSCCSELKRITIPQSVTTIEPNVFENCEGLVISGYAGSYAETYANENLITFEPIAVEDPYIASGTCGDNLTWTLDENYQLIIEGEGAMYDFDTAPWADYDKQIVSLIIKDGVTSIGSYAFYYSAVLSSVSLPETLTTIGEYSFAYNYALSFVNLPQSLETVGAKAFFKCGLYDIILPEGIVTIESGAFGNCTNLLSIHIPASVTMFDGAFSGCSSLEKISISDDNPMYYCVGECVIKKGTTVISLGCKNSIIPADGSVTEIGNGAFGGCSGLVSLAIPDSITKIGDGAFVDCSSLESVIIPSSVTSIGQFVFTNCENVTIYGYDGTAAQTYAESYKLEFVSLDTLPEKGDLDFDGRVNARDYYLLKLVLNGMQEIDGNIEFSADINSDGNCNIQDMYLLKRSILGL